MRHMVHGSIGWSQKFFLVYYNSLVWTQKVVLPVPALKIAVTCGHINETFNIFFGTYRM